MTVKGSACHDLAKIVVFYGGVVNVMTAGPPTERLKVTVSVLFLMSTLAPPEVSKSRSSTALVVPPPLRVRSGS